MKDWILANTTVTEEEYDKIMQYNDYPEDANLTKVSEESKKQILLNIVAFTLNKPSIINKIVHQIKKLNGVYYYKGYTFGLFYDCYQDNDLFSMKRYGRCHEMSSLILSKEQKLKMVTAICRTFKNIPFLHSFLIWKDEFNKEYVYDYTENLVMNKEAYFDLLDVEVINVMDYDTLKIFLEAYESNKEQYKYINITELLCFPNQIKEAILKLERTKKQ